MAYLLVKESGNQQIIELPEDKEFIIGRAEGVDLVLPHRKISRKHLSIFKKDNIFYIKDLNSTNGTFINGVKIEDEIILNDKDEIRIGDITIVFSLEEPNILEEFNPMMTQISEAKSQAETEHPQDFHRLKSLLELTNYLNSIHDYRKLLDIFLQATLKLLKADRGFVMLKGPNNQFEIAVQKFMKTELKQKNYSKSACRRAIQEKRCILAGDTRQDDLFSQQNSILVNKISSILVVPIILKDEVIGIIYLDNIDKQKGFSEEDADFAQSIASQAAISIYNSRLYESLLKEKNLIQNILESMGDGLVVLNSQYLPIRMNKIAKKFFSTAKEQLKYFIKEIKNLNQKDSIIDIVVLKPFFSILSCNVKFFNLTKNNKGVIINFRDITQQEKEHSLKNKLFTLLSQQVKDSVIKLKLEHQLPKLETLEEKIDLQNHFLRMEAGPLRLHRENYTLKTLLDKFSELEKEEKITAIENNKFEFDIESLEFVIKSFLSIGKITSSKISIYEDNTENEFVFSFLIKVLEPFDKDLATLVKLNYDVLEFIEKIEDNEMIKRGMFVKLSYVKNIISAHGGKLDIKQLERDLHFKIEFTIPALEAEEEKEGK